MTSSVMITLALIGAITWAAYLLVQGLRSRGPEEIPPNLAPGESDDSLETRRLERVQQAAVLLSAFLAVGLPLYFLGETDRQDSFVEAFHEESVERGLEHFQEFQCASCHGADGGGGATNFVEQRSGVTVTWAVPSINDVFYRYDRESVSYWLTYGRQNTPMPAWGLAGGGPMSPSQVDELLDYLESDEFQITQAEAAAKVEPAASAALSSLDQAGATIATAIVEQRQVLAEIERAPELTPVLADLAAQADELGDSLADGLDTDGDGVADAQEVAVNQILAQAKQTLLLPGVEEITVEGGADPDLAASIVDGYRALADDGRAPILEIYATAIEGIVASQEGDDTDGDGLTDTAEAQIGAQVVLAVGAVTGDFQVSNLDPANPESVPGVSDSETAATALNEIATRYTQVRLNDTNYDELKPAAEESLENLRRAQEDAKWGFDFEAIADHVFGGDAERARQVVGLFEANCARCHTSGYSAGLPYTQEAGSGAFGPALYDGRPAVQFLSDEDLRDFLIEGSVANQPYGVNGMGKQNAPMPGFGETLAEDDLLDLATWLRAGDLTGRSDS